MKTKLDSDEINKQTLEIKKKIQLSEGQRKAAFEDCEAERKHNTEEIHKLKKEIKQLVKDLKETTEINKGVKASEKQVEAVIGPLNDKPPNEIKHLLDLQIVDKTKVLDLIQYKIKKRLILLEDLGKEYHTLLSQAALKEVKEKVDKPNKKASSDLQNSIHAVEVQLREANHISIRYQTIKTTLQNDGARFESNIKRIEEELMQQENDINKLQQVMTEATHKRSKARGHLFREEKSAVIIANSRERQTLEGRRLVNSRKQELEFLEKKMIEAQKLQTQSETLGENDVQTNEEDEISDVTQPPEEILEQAFEVLKKATGATNADEVLEKFSAQKDTFNRLVLLRQEAEEKKKKLEKEVEQLNTKLEYYKYAEAKETEKKTTKMEQTQELIDEEKERSKKALATKTLKNQIMQKILLSVRDLHKCVNPLAIPGNSILAILTEITNDLNQILEKSKQQITEDATENADITEEKWLPAPYSGLVRRTPLPQPGVSPAPPPPPTSDDEEEVPSRCYLKRQAQLVVDAKSRRKNVRMQPPKRN